MKSSDIFHKTAKGQAEIETKTNALTVKQRRVLILVNGQNNAATLREYSLCDNIAEILGTLLGRGFIDHGDTTGAKYDRAAKEGPTTEINLGAREFMCNTLLTFANRVRVGKLIDEINAAENVDSLKDLVKPWYRALSDTPGGMYQADDLRKELLQMLQNEDIGGLQ